MFHPRNVRSDTQFSLEFQASYALSRREVTEIPTILIIQINFLLQVLTISLNLLNRRSSLVSILAEQVLLSSTPNVHFGTIEFGIDDYLHWVLIYPILNDFRTRKDSFYGIVRCAEFLFSTVTVAALSDRWRRKREQRE